MNIMCADCIGCKYRNLAQPFDWCYFYHLEPTVNCEIPERGPGVREVPTLGDILRKHWIDFASEATKP